jgi:hypothetical protein
MTTALITGASSGLGAEYARQLAASGTDLVLVARDAAALDALAAELGAATGVEVEVIAADLLEPAECAWVEARLADADRPIETLVNNAGFGLPLAFERNAIDDEVRHLRLHDEVPMRLAHAVLPGMLDRGHGRILNVASVAAFIPRSTYSACKQWLVSFSRWANGAYRDRGITVTAVCPGYTHTSFHERLGLPPGQEGVPDWMWLQAPDVVRASLRDVDRGKPVSIPSARYKAIVALVRVLPSSVSARLGERGR